MVKRAVLALLVLFPCAVLAQGTFTAASCSQADVNAVINGPTHTAVNGDTIIIPTTGSPCTWASGIAISGVGITIKGTGTPNTGGGTVGAGTPSTTLIDNASAPFFVFTGLTVSSSTAKVELLNMQPVTGAGANTILAAVTFLGTCTTSTPFCPSVRVDNIDFSTGSTSWKGVLSGGYVVIDNVFGVVDHTTTVENPVSGTTSPLVQVNFDAWRGVGSFGDNSFASADTFGTAQTFFIENNSISGVRGEENDVTPSGGANGGERVVCRFNTFTNLSGVGVCSAHGTAWGGRFRGQRQIEVYYNTASLPASTSGDAGNGLNGGTGYYFSNTYSTTSGFGLNKFVALDIGRFVQNSAPWNACDGTEPWDFAPWSSTTACLDQPGSGAGAGLENTTPVLVSAPGTPCTTAGQCWPNPALDPVYEAGEVMTAGGLGAPVVIAADGTSTRVLFNRDAYEEVSQSAQSSATSPFNGTTGTGYGALARRPTTCTTGVGYWATDTGSWNTYNSQQGTLYICTSTNTWTSSYTPYTYPHPLDTSGSVTTPPAPSHGKMIAARRANPAQKEQRAD